MARTTSADVENILASNYDGSTGLQPVIDTATVLVDWLAAKDVDGELSATALERIECLLAAHIYCHHDKVAQSKNTGRAGGTFQGQTAMILASSDYGQTAMLLDVTGRLAERSRQAEAGAPVIELAPTWLGKPPSEEIEYVDRD